MFVAVVLSTLSGLATCSPSCCLDVLALNVLWFDRCLYLCISEYLFVCWLLRTHVYSIVQSCTGGRGEWGGVLWKMRGVAGVGGVGGGRRPYFIYCSCVRYEGVCVWCGMVSVFNLCMCQH